MIFRSNAIYIHDLYTPPLHRESLLFPVAGRGADDFGEGGRTRARPGYVAVAHVGVVMGPGGVLSDDPDVVPGDQPAEIRDAAAAGVNGPGDRLLGRRQAAEGIREQREFHEEIGLRFSDEGGGALVPQVLPLPGAPA